MGQVYLIYFFTLHFFNMNTLYYIVTIKELFAEFLHLIKIRINKTKSQDSFCM